MTKVRIYQSRKSGGKSRNQKTVAGSITSVKGSGKVRLDGKIVRDSITGQFLPADAIREVAKRVVEAGMVTAPPAGIKGKTIVVRQVSERQTRTARPNFTRLSPEELVEREYQRHKLLMDLLAK